MVKTQQPQVEEQKRGWKFKIQVVEGQKKAVYINIQLCIHNLLLTQNWALTLAGPRKKGPKTYY